MSLLSLSVRSLTLSARLPVAYAQRAENGRTVRADAGVRAQGAPHHQPGPAEAPRGAACRHPHARVWGRVPPALPARGPPQHDGAPLLGKVVSHYKAVIDYHSMVQTIWNIIRVIRISNRTLRDVPTKKITACVQNVPITMPCVLVTGPLAQLVRAWDVWPWGQGYESWLVL